MSRFLVGCLLFLTPAATLAQFTPTKEPVGPGGIRATVDLPNSQHKRNTGGSDGAGLCVYTSVWHIAIWQNVQELNDFRRYMESRPGGSYPEKFDATIKAYCRGKGIAVPPYVQHTGGVEDFLDIAMKTGRCVGITYCGVDGPNGYGNDVISHMVNLVYLDKKVAAILDNNFPGRLLWMTRAELVARWKGVDANGNAFYVRDRFGRGFPVGGGWAIVLLAAPPAPYPFKPSAFEHVYATPLPAARGSVGKTAPGCNCEDCKCKDHSKCPLLCPAVVGQCPNCPTPVCPNCPTPLATPDTTPAPIGSPPSDRHYWGYFPELRQYGWRLRDDAPAYPVSGVDSSKLSHEPRYSLNGIPCSEDDANKAILADDSGKWNLSIVGDEVFRAAALKDVEKLPADIRGKLHVQSYAADSWQVTQFALMPGVTLRRPAVGRIGGEVGHLAADGYTSAKLLDLLGVAEGPAPKPQPAPQPAPAPLPQPVPQPMPAPQPAPQPQPAPAPMPHDPANPMNPPCDPAGCVAALLGLLWYFYTLARDRLNVSVKLK